MDLIQITKDNVQLLQALADDSKTEGFRFVQRTIDQWLDGTNDFSKPNEVFYAIVEEGVVVSMGGINIDPYTNDSKVGRIRHVYTKIEYRCRGFSTIILKKLMEDHSKHFSKIRLFTNNPIAASFYESMGFKESIEDNASHVYFMSQT